MNVSALYVRNDSIYKLLGIDSWDIDRDARNYAGKNAVICHPPCRSWGKLKHFAKPRADEKELAITAIGQVRKWGGVLEHPSGSSLWKECGLPVGADIDKFGGFTLCIDQHWFGHCAKKRTLLYIVGCNPTDIPDYPLKFELPTHVIGSNRKRHPGQKGVSQRLREHTPEAFAKFLIDLAEICYKQRK